MQKIHEHYWAEALKNEFEKDYFKSLEKKIDVERRHGIKIYPQQWDVFRAYDSCPLPMVKVVIIGQDPYHGPKQANGLAFGVKEIQELPPTLKNIIKELKINNFNANHGNLSQWAIQGVFLLNTILTVEEGKPLSHANLGWEIFTDKTIEILSEQDRPIVWILWGKHAHIKKGLIRNKKHLVIESPHPSPLSAYKGFFWSKPFQRANSFLLKNGIHPINWNIE